MYVIYFLEMKLTEFGEHLFKFRKILNTEGLIILLSINTNSLALKAHSFPITYGLLVTVRL